MRRGSTSGRRTLRRAMLRLAWRVSPHPWGDSDAWRADCQRHGWEPEQFRRTQAERLAIVVDLLIEGGRPSTDEDGFVWIGRTGVMQPVQGAVTALAAALDAIGRIRVPAALLQLLTERLAELPERLADAERSAVEPDPPGSPPTCVLAVAALCSAPRPGPLAALAA